LIGALLTTQAAAAYLGLSKPTLERFRLSGDGPIYAKLTPGPKGSIRYRTDDLDRWVAGRLVRSTSDSWPTNSTGVGANEARNKS